MLVAKAEYLEIKISESFYIFKLMGHFVTRVQFACIGKASESFEEAIRFWRTLESREEKGR